VNEIETVHRPGPLVHIEAVDFYIDPSCPWAWRGARWIKGAAALDAVDVTWRFFSLKLVNEGRKHPRTQFHSEGLKALRTLSLVRRRDGNNGVARAYEAIGARCHEHDEELSTAVLIDGLTASGLDGSLVDEAMGDEATLAEVRDEHDAVVRSVGAFGVPIVVLADGRGVFGPVLGRVPEGDDAVELWSIVRALIVRDGFYELKRARP
jgi:predicted DsbA family dithiol-disulfide isomerase